MADRLILTNDSTKSYDYDEELFIGGFVNQTSAHGAAATTHQVVGVAKRPGRIVDAFVVATPGLSVSGFVSGTVSANVRINSVSALSTLPGIVMATSAGDYIQKATNKTANGATSAVVNSASANFSAGDVITVDFTTQSGNSGTIASVGQGMVVGVLVRYSPN